MTGIWRPHLRLLAEELVPWWEMTGREVSAFLGEARAKQARQLPLLFPV